MASLTLSNLVSTEESKQIVAGSYPSDKYKCLFEWSTSSPITKTSRALSYTEERTQPSTPVSNNNRFKHLCTRLKRRFSITKDYRKHSEDLNRGLSVRFSNYKSISSSVEETYNEFDWPDFEKVYDSIPSCLAKTLPGLDDILIEDDDDDDDNHNNNTNIEDTTYSIIDETNDGSNLFDKCKRGKNFRRNAICSKLDKSQYHGQLDTFVQQLMIEKLMRTWT